MEQYLQHCDWLPIISSYGLLFIHHTITLPQTHPSLLTPPTGLMWGSPLSGLLATVQKSP